MIDVSTGRRRSVLYIDIDGVACEHAKAICEWVNQKYSINCQVNDVKTWDHDFGPITFVQAVKTSYRDDGFLLKMGVTPGFNEFLTKVVEGIDVRFITTREQYSECATREWISTNFGRFEVCFTKKKEQLVMTNDYLIDDNPEEIVAASQKARGCFLIGRPWNNNEEVIRRISKFGQIHFVNAFEAILKFL